MRKILTLFALFICVVKTSHASHILGADITYTALDSFKFEFKVSVYRDCSGIAMQPWEVKLRSLDTLLVKDLGKLDTSDRTIKDITPTCATQNSCGSTNNQPNSTKGIERHTYYKVIDLKTNDFKQFLNSACWIRFEIRQNSRSQNITTGLTGALYTYADVNICHAPTNSSPKLTTKPTPFLCCNQPVRMNVGAADYADFDAVSYKWARPKSKYQEYWNNYNYYQPFTVYYPGSLTWPYTNTSANPPIGFFLDSVNGDIIFTPTKCDEVTVAVLEITEWRKINGKMEEIGRVRRDMQYEISNCSYNKAPKIRFPQSNSFNPILCDSVITFILETEDMLYNKNKPSTDSVRVVANLLPKGAVMELLDSTSRTPKAKVTWTVSRAQRNKPKYVNFSFSAFDNRCPYNAVTHANFQIYVHKNFANTKVDVYNFDDDNGNCKKDSGERGIPHRYVQARFKNSDQYGFQYVLNDTGYNQLCTDSGEYNLRLKSHPFYTDFCSDTTLNATPEKVHQVSFGSKFHNQSVAGHVNEDIDKSCSVSDSEKGLQGVIIKAIPGPHYTTTDIHGDYLLKLPEGKYSITTEPKRYQKSCGKSYVVDVKKEPVQTGKDFNVFIDSSNIKIDGVFRRTLRQGRFYTHQINVIYNGYDTIKNVRVILERDKRLKISSKTNYSTLNDSTVKFALDIYPNSNNLLEFTCQVPTTIPIGTALSWEVFLESALKRQLDVDSTDNWVHKKSSIIGSYDPNIKETDEDSVITAFDSILHYTVHFQNTGTAPAYYVELRDTLPLELNEGSFEFLSSSHQPVNYILQDRTLYFIFDDIELADSASNEEASKGFVKFKINTKQGFLKNTSIRNNASIYFDFNEPIKTADQVNTIKSPISVRPVARDYYCAGDTIELSFFTRFIPLKGNSFDIEMSNEKGDFSSGMILKTFSSNATEGKEVILLPIDLPAGANYQFRIMGSDKRAITFLSDYSNTFEVIQDLTDSIQFSKSTLCQGEPVNLEVNNKFGNRYKLFRNNVEIDSNATGVWDQQYFQATDELFVEVSLDGKCPHRTDNYTLDYRPLPKPSLKLDSLICGRLTLPVKNATTSEDRVASLLVYWGDGSVDNLGVVDTITHQYFFPKEFEIKAIAITSYGCKDTADYKVTIANQPEALFSVSSKNCLNDTLTIFHESTVQNGQIDSVFWQTPNGKNSGNQLNELMPSDGEYTIGLKVKSNLGCVDSTSQKITVYRNPVAKISVAEHNACFHLNSYEFDLDEGLSAHAISQQVWRYDGLTSMLSTPILHSFSTAGDFDIILNIEDDNGCEAADTHQVEVLEFLPAMFNVNELTQCLKENDFSPTEYSDGSIFAGAAHEWEISDGSEYSSSTFSHHFNAKGIYTITHRTALTNLCRDTFKVGVTVNPNPKVDFTTKDVCQGDESIFINLSNAQVDVDDEQWFLYNVQQVYTATQKEVRYIFPASGTFEVQCIQGAKGCYDTLLKNHVVKPTPQMNVFHEVLVSNAVKVRFENNSIGGNGSTIWDFGDGSDPLSTSVKGIEYLYQKPGVYVVSVTEESPEGCIAQSDFSIDVFGGELILIPDAFSPNGDGINDKFNIGNSELIRAFHMELFDRWGRKVAISEHEIDVFKDHILNPGFYLYELKIIDIYGKSHFFKGNIAVVK